MATLAKLTGAVPPALALHHARKLLKITGAPLAKLNACAALGAVWVALGVALAITGNVALFANVTPLALVLVLVVAILVPLLFTLGKALLPPNKNKLARGQKIELVMRDPKWVILHFWVIWLFWVLGCILGFRLHFVLLVAK
jgi:hypothetical protein